MTATKDRRQVDRVPALVGVCIAMALSAAGCSRIGQGPARSATPAVPVADIGSADTCRRTPRFTSGMDLSPRAQIGTSIEGVMGLAIVDPATGSLVQPESWDDAGYLGPFTYDNEGNIYTAPVPLVSLMENPPGEQNRVYRVDSDTAVMNEWIELEPARPPSAMNPFGVVALGFDCDTRSLYAASLMGSTPDEEVGRVFRIDVDSRTVGDVLEGIDTMGVGVFTGVSGKRLYFGHAREASLSSIALDAAGDFVGEPRRELLLADLDGGRDERVQRITFTAGQHMLLKGIPFRYTLRGAFDTGSTAYTVRYVPEEDAWAPVSVERR